MNIITIIIFNFLVIIRYLNIEKIPIFIDEQTYLKLGKNAFENPHEILLSLKYLVFPVVPTILGLLQQLSVNFINPLIIGRFVFVTADIVSSFFVYLIAKKLFSKNCGILSALVYLTIPLNFFHSRLILLEPFTNLFLVGGFYYFLKISDKPISLNSYKGILDILKISLLFTLSFLSKPLAIVSFTTLPIFSMIKFIEEGKRSQKKLIILLLLPILIVFSVSLPFIGAVWNGFSDYRVRIQVYELFTNFKSNIWLTIWWLRVYITYPIIYACTAAIFYSFFKKNLKLIGIFLWFSSVIFLENLIGTNYLPRHLFLAVAPISVMSGFILWKLWVLCGKQLGILILTFILILPLTNIIKIIKNPITAPLAPEDKQQFFYDWTSSVGLNLIAADLKKLSYDQHLVVYTEADVGFGWALKNLYSLDNISIIETKELNVQNQNYKLFSVIDKSLDTYIILNRNTEPPKNWPIELIKSYPKITEVRVMSLYKYRTSK